MEKALHLCQKVIFENRSKRAISSTSVRKTKIEFKGYPLNNVLGCNPAVFWPKIVAFASQYVLGCKIDVFWLKIVDFAS